MPEPTRSIVGGHVGGSGVHHAVEAQGNQDGEALPTDWRLAARTLVTP